MTAAHQNPSASLDDRELVLGELARFQTHMDDPPLEGRALETEARAISGLLTWSEDRLKRSFFAARKLASLGLVVSASVILVGVGFGVNLILRGEDQWVLQTLAVMALELAVLVAGRLLYSRLQRVMRRSLVALAVLARHREATS
jgi:hypothetical protein